MSRIVIPKREDVPVGSREILAQVEKSMGVVPNVIRLLALSPDALAGFVALQSSLAKSLTPRIRSLISLTVSEANSSEYCLAAHSFVGREMTGLNDDEIMEARKGSAKDQKEDAVVRFVRKVADLKGNVSSDDLDQVRQAGFTDAEIIEVILLCAQFSLTNLVNNVFDTEVDFPPVELR